MVQKSTHVTGQRVRRISFIIFLSVFTDCLSLVFVRHWVKCTQSDKKNPRGVIARSVLKYVKNVGMQIYTAPWLFVVVFSRYQQHHATIVSPA